MTLPIVELLADRGTAESRRITRFLPMLRSWCDLRAPDPRLRAVARLSVSPKAPGLWAALDEPQPLAVTLDSATALDPRVRERADVLLVFDAPSAEAGLGERMLVVPVDGIDAAAHPPIAPFVRARWRLALELPAELVVAVGVADVAPLAEATVPTALALASAAAMVGPWTVTALALGTPVVTDGVTADRLGAVDGEHVVIAHPGRARAVASEVGADHARAAALSHQARLLVEQRHDLRGVARELLRRLGVLPSAGVQAPLLTLQARLDELGTPAAGLPVLRALAACRPLAGGRPLAELTGTRR
jgi:hypothetical protein